jgi:hypothetical protein
MSTTPRKAAVDPCRAERNAADRAQNAVELTESKLKGELPAGEKRRLEKLLAQQRLTLGTARRALSTCERAHPGKKRSAKKAAPKKKKKKT